MSVKQKKIIIFFLFAIITTAGLLWLGKVTHAQQLDLGLQQVSSTIGLPATDIRLVIAKIIRAALGLLGIVALVLIIYGGFIWMTAGGNEEKISQAKKILVNAVIGLAIILSSYAITSFIINKLVGATIGMPEHCFNGQKDADEEDIDCGGIDCAPCSGGNNPYFPSGVFFVESLPTGGALCIRNVHLAVTFNLDVDSSTLAGNLAILNDNGREQDGVWQTINGNTAAFTPNGDCGDGGHDCLAALTNYKLHFQNSANIKSTTGLSLNCNMRAGCHDVNFMTGEGVDRLPPHVKIEPIPDDLLRVGQVIPVQVSYTDDNGVQKVDLRADAWFVGSQTVTGCQKIGTVSINWPTNGLSSGRHTLAATGYDWSMAQDTTSTNVNLKPPHCFDGILQRELGEEKAGPPDCGGECGACEGDDCTENSQCASGYCQIPPGKCVDRMRINAISPPSGGVGTYVSISGNYFGATPGHVYINNTEAHLALDCGPQAWQPWQIIVEVPAGAATGPIKVVTDKWRDATNDDFGPRLNDFEVNNIMHPGLCRVEPETDLPGEMVVLSGKNFGVIPDKVFFGQLNAFVSPNDWSDKIIGTRVPLLESGPVAAKVSRSSVESNSVRFFVEEGINSTTPLISSINPDHGARGEYITIIGNNFGALKGRVWFKINNNGEPGDAIDGDFDSFPPECKNTWSDTQIIVKFPQDKGAVGASYFVQVRPADISKGWSPIGPTFNLEAGTPRPGICSISPVSGPIPFAPDAPAMRIAGEYFGDNPDVYFWKNGASPDSIDRRVRADSVTSSPDGHSLDLYPPTGVQTGPVIAYRADDRKMSNSEDFSVLDCVKNNKTCTEPNTHCCVAGAEVGMCKSNTELCEGETLSTGYIWRFATKDIPKVPRVVERCNQATDEGKNIPTPSPSAQWDATPNEDHHNVCRTASVVVEFNVADINPISRGDLLVYECNTSTVDESKRICEHFLPPVEIRGSGDFIPERSTEDTAYLELNPSENYNNNTGKWKDGAWYQVVLKTGISAGSGDSVLYLAKDKPCNAFDITGSAYCFVFKTDAQDCKMKAVVITPYSYWTSVLEEPIKYRVHPADEGEDLIYRGHGLSSQHCILMDVSGFDWDWDSQRTDYADIYARMGQTAKVSALANTVAVGLRNPEDAVNIEAQASTGTVSYTGSSPLTIDLSNPEVVDYWPKCLEACTNAEVGVRFNVTMSNRNINPYPIIDGPVQLLKCNDENCFDTTPVLSPSDVELDSVTIPKYTVLKIANSQINSSELEPNTIYKVVLSASSSDPNNTRQLWSAAKLADPSTYSKPYNKEFIWRFRTKKEKCKIDHVEVSPSRFVATHINDRAVYQAQPYAAPDACSAQGQKLNPWTVSWEWSSSDIAVAVVRSSTTKGYNPYCTKKCIRRGSSIPLGKSAAALCGNGRVEAGEDCDPPNKNQGCGLNCKRLGNADPSICGNGIVEPNAGEQCDPQNATTSVGCNNICLHTGSEQTPGPGSVTSSICGNGFIGSGEDCDLGISANPADPRSKVGCSEKCLHLGVRLSTKWCFDNAAVRGGFSQQEYGAACKLSISQCGDDVAGPDEDPRCDGPGVTPQQREQRCNIWCLVNNADFPALGCTGTTTPEGCSPFTRQHLGSSLRYSAPSVCGDEAMGIGEDTFCETDLEGTHGNLIDPWSLAKGVGMGNATGTPPTQQSDIKASTNQNTRGGTIEGKGEFVIPCGFKTDAECQARMGGDSWGVGANSCCYPRPKLIDVYPGSLTSIQQNVCPNTVIEAEFDGQINKNTLPGNLIIARGIGENRSPTLREVWNVPLASGGIKNFVFTSGNYAYVANGVNGLRIMDISKPSAAQEVGVFGASLRDAFFAGVYVAGHYAYVADQGTRVLRVIDISSSTAPEQVGSVSIPNSAEPKQVYVAGHYAYVVGGEGGGGHIIDITDPINPKVVLSSPGGPFEYRKVYVRNQYAYIIDNVRNLNIFDISSSTQVESVGSTTIKDAFDFDVAGQYIYLAGGIDGLRVIDISDPTKPHEVSFYNEETDINFKSIYIYKNLAFIGNQAAGSLGLYVVDVSDPFHPKKLEFFRLPGSPTPSPRSIMLRGDFAYIAEDSGLAIIDVSKYTNNCYASDDVTHLLMAFNGDVNSPWYQKVWTRLVRFFMGLFGRTAAAEDNTPSKWCAGLDIGTPQMVRASTSTASRVSVQLTAPLAADTTYAIILKDGIRDARGISIGKKSDGTNINWKFVTASKICEVSSVSVQPGQVYLGKVGATSTLKAEALSSSGGKIQSIPGYYAWEYMWGPLNNPFVTMQDATTTTNTIAAQNRNGEIDIRASAKITDNKYTDQSGVAATGKSHVIVFLCENPWPPKDLYLPDKSGPFVIFPYKDAENNNDNYDLTDDSFDNTAIPPSPIGGYFNFSAYYCADNGSAGTVDDLPYLRPAVQVAPDIVSPTSSLKRFIFTNNKNSDAVGIQIFPNSKHLTVGQWFEASKEYGGQGFIGSMQSSRLDGYDAITDGNNIYVDALNYAPSLIGGSIYSNIYLFSINADAQAETKKVFEQMMNNLRFNTNLTNFGYCGPTMVNPGTTTTCATDLDCQLGEVCSVQIDKLKRNYQRLRDLNEIQNVLGQ